jgi:hypothetical protein
MSTYIVAFANGQFEYLESSYTSPLSGTTRPLRIYGEERLHPPETLLISDHSHTRPHSSSAVRPGYEGPGPADL